MERRLVVDSATTEKYLRIACMSIGCYDYILTLPAEWRFYRSQSSIFHLSIVTIVASNYGFFSTTFTQQACQKYYLVAPIFKAVQTMISQVILGVRTFNIARRDRRIGIAILLLYLFLISAEWFADLFHGTPAVFDVCSVSYNEISCKQRPFFTQGNCTSVNSAKVLSTWFYYLPVMLYDIVMVTVSTIHLLHYNPLSSRVERLIWVLIYDGIGYFLVLSASNVLNLILYHTTDIETQSAGASMGYAVTWIMSQRILINVQESNAQRLENVIIARPILTAQKKVMSGLRSQFESKSHSKGSKSSRSPIDAEFRPTSPRNPNDMELDIHARVERTVAVDHMDGSKRSTSWGPPVVK
ncbi:hypothetical protein EV702DRAFT_144196 [Suillus placidus]|uniref:Uncharacterized protein n=1 Tax=Suillus placidus TaxID=48579 RepID=A0A9P6ZZ97_9AGAM|nr:hypothetical protein EV702DRAFT_144196 [Suillus placidus]